MTNNGLLGTLIDDAERDVVAGQCCGCCKTCGACADDQNRGWGGFGEADGFVE